MFSAEITRDEVVEVSARRGELYGGRHRDFECVRRSRARSNGSSKALQRILISAAALPLRADAPSVYVAAAPFIEGEVFCWWVLSRRSPAAARRRRKIVGSRADSGC